MTNENKRVNNSKSVIVVNYANIDEVAKNLQAVADSGTTLYNFNKLLDDEGNLLDYGAGYDLFVIPQYDSENKDKLSYYMCGVVPTFDSLVDSEQGKNYLKSQFEIRTIKRIRDNQRLAIADGRQFTLPVEIAEFVSVSRAGSGIGEDFKKAVAELTKALQAKFAKLPQAKLLLTQKTVLTAINNEAFAIKYLPFTVTKDGNSIFGKWLENTIGKFESANKPTDDLKSILSTRLTAELEESDEATESELDDLF